MKLFPRIGCAAVLALSFGGILIFETAGLADETFTLDTARAAADKGDPQAEYFLARQYAHGSGVPRDYTRAVKYLRQAAAQGYAPAQTGLGSCYGHGQGVQRDYAQAVQWYRKAAAQGDSMAEYCLGLAFANGLGAPRDKKEAVAWWQKAATQGQVDAEYSLGNFYLHGDYFGDTNNVNYAQAALWFRKAAEQNYAPAMSALGFMYQSNLGVDPDLRQALQWNRQAAEMNDATGEDNLGLMYENGNAGLPHDLVEAYKWFWLSDKQGNRFGEHDVIEIEMHHSLTDEQMAEAKCRAAEFLTKFHANRPAATSEVTTGSKEVSR